MREDSVKIIAFFIILVLSGCTGFIGKQGSKIVITDVQETLEKTLDTYLEANIPEDGPGVSLFLIKDRQLVYSASRGMASIPAAIRVNENTGFLIASASKFFTALAIMQLYEKGLISPDDSILQHLSELPAAWRNITVHHLLTHQSGIPDWSNDMSLTKDWPDGVTNAHIIDFFSKNETLEFQPGSKGEYSNTGYALLSVIVARLSGIRFAQYMAENIFEPLGMSNSYVYDENAVPAENTALNYARHTTQHSGRNVFVVGERAVVTTNNDMQRFTRGIAEGIIVSFETLELMLQPYSVLINQNYGYGAFVDSKPPNEGAFLHAGSFDGHLALMIVSADKQSSLVILGNGHISNVAPYIIGRLVSDFYNRQPGITKTTTNNGKNNLQ